MKNGERITRDKIVPLYKSLVEIGAIFGNNVIDWGTINQAIINRWSRNALEYIKNNAWKLINEENQYLVIQEEE